MTGSSLQILPYEVLVSIFDILDPKSMASACLISRVCNEAATSVLYKSTSWDLSTQGVSWDMESPPWLAFGRLPWLQSHVQSLAICLDTGPSLSASYDPTDEVTWEHRHGRTISRLSEEIDRLPSIRHLELLTRHGNQIHWSRMKVFKIKISWFGQLVHTLGGRIQEITLPELPFYNFQLFPSQFLQSPSYPQSLVLRSKAGYFVRSAEFKSWAPHLKRVSFLHNSELNEVNGLFTSLRCLRVESHGTIDPFIRAIASSRGLVSLEMTVSYHHLRHWTDYNLKNMEFPALKYLRLRMSGPADEDTVRNGRQLFKCICSGSDALLSVSIDISMPRRNCRASEEFAVWIARVHGRTMKSLYLDYLTLGEDCIHRVLSSCPQLECFGFTPLWRLMDLVQTLASLRFGLSLKVIYLTVARSYSDRQVYSALVQNFPHIKHLLLRTKNGASIKCAWWKGEWNIGPDSETVSRVVKRAECSEKDWEYLISREQREFVDSLKL